jgi:integrase
VPLVGDALEAAKEALKATGAGVQGSSGVAGLVPAYCREGGPTAASAALMKHVRAVVADKKVTTHSLRHLMKDRLRLAEVDIQRQEALMGHSSGKVAEDYGGSATRLLLAKEALERALAVSIP